jgi:chromosome segregation ATPase
MAKSETNKKLLTLEDEHEEASRELKALQEEQSTLSQRMAAAGQLGAADTILTLQARADELPTRLLGAEAKALRLRIRCLEAELPELIEEDRAQAEDAAAAQSAADEARLRLDRAQNQYWRVREQRSTVEINIADLQRELNRVVARLTMPPAPVVRSRPHGLPPAA